MNRHIISTKGYATLYTSHAGDDQHAATLTVPAHVCNGPETKQYLVVFRVEETIHHTSPY